MRRGDTAALDAELQRRLIGWRPRFIGTLVFLEREGELLLIDKLSGHGAGKINAPGGKVERGETLEVCAVRETREEVGVEIREPRLVARLRFVERTGDQWLGYAFLARRFDGTPVETREARPKWYARDALPFARMWADDRIWLPRVLAGERIEGDFLFDDGRLLAHDVRAVDVVRIML